MTKHKLKFSKTQWKLYCALSDNVGIVVPVRILAHRVAGFSFDYPLQEVEYIRPIMSRLRDKLKRLDYNCTIVTVYGKGYKMVRE